MCMKEENCKHQYESKTSKEQEVYSKYLTEGKFLNQVLEQEIITLFCSKCGDYKKLPTILNHDK